MVKTAEIVAAVAVLLSPGINATLVSSHVFSNHKGGCGKTTMMFHVSCEYALRNKEERILVIDTTLRGDLSELLLGGDKGAAGKQAVRAVGHLRSTSKLLMQAAAVHAAHDGDDTGHMSALVGKLFKGLASKKSPAVLDFDDLLIHVQDFNPAIPDNVYLCPGGSGPQTSYPLAQRLAIAATLRQCLEESDTVWKVMCDTDGDQGFSDYTKIALALSDRCIIPLKTNVNDFSNRCVPMMEELFLMRQSGEAQARIQMIVWNEVDVYKNTASPVSGMITPPKAAQGVISMLNALVAEVAATYPDLFYNAPPLHASDIEPFTSASTMCMRSFGVTGLAAAEHGLPFCSMREGKLQGGRLVYEIAAEQRQQLQHNVIELADRLNDPPLGA
mmetsp:Transcript_19676/g.31425  ORF Transcript_19676/g.31425 Transcript_19676/m.31425 type:complete len:387 (-) Transcript_19676:24-1184(-)